MNHSLHFTYEPPNQPDLLQGDVIQKTTEILALIKEVHPHYLRDDYTHLMITTQSCDLVRRGSEKTTNSRYITLVAVRPFETALERELAKYQKSDIEAHSICGMKTKTKIVDFAKSLLNNNREDFFYLHEEPSLNFSNSCCAFLRLPISIRCKDHYEKCLSARVLSLNDNFRAKLGHHIGQIYSRVGTDDWVPNHSSERDFNERAKRYADSLCQWVEDADLKAVEKMYAKLQPPLKNKADFLDFFEANRPKKRKERVISRVTEILEDSSLIEQKTIDKIKILLTNDSALTSDLL